MTKKIFWTLLFFIFPLSTNAQVLFSEIAWMGTADDANNEWIELFNHGQESVSVDGWTLTDGNALNIALVGTIAPQTIVVLERTDDTTLPSITAFQIYTGALANDGRTLTLKRADGAVEDQAIGGDAWGSIGGSNETKETPQRAMTTWVTGVPTPGAQNVTHDSGTNQQTTNNTNQNTTQNTNTTNTSVQKTKSGGGSNKGSKVPLVPGVLSLSIDAPEIAYVNQQVTLVAQPMGLGKTLTSSLGYMWNFGDTNTGAHREVTHTFAYPGTYVVFVEGSFVKQRASARHEITVLPVSFELTRTSGGDLLLTNKAPHEVNLSGFRLQGTQLFEFPKHTFIKTKGTITIPQQKIGGPTDIVSLIDTKRVPVAIHQLQNRTINPLGLAAQLSAPTKTPQASLPLSESKEAIKETVGSETAVQNIQEVIQIGSRNVPQEESGLLGRFFKKITSVFGK